MNSFQAIILGIVEGLTEFLPISSTGHMILTSTFLGISQDEFTKLFEVCIQLGAILAVVVLYRRKFLNLHQGTFYKKILVAVCPSLVLGFLLAKKVDDWLESSTTVAVTMVLGGIFLLFVDKLFHRPVSKDEEEVSYKQALVIGFWQVLAMVPGVSRSGATIVGGMQQKLTREAAAEFSFFLAVPTMCAATGYKLLKALIKTPELLLNAHNLWLLFLGNLVGFVVALIAIKTFLTYLHRHGFRLFGVYRIVAGVIILALIYGGKL